MGESLKSIDSAMKLHLIILSVFVTSGLALPAETIKEFEDEFHELWSDPKDEAAAAKELADEEASIEQDNLDYENGKSSYSEKLNELSALTKDEFEAEKLGLLDETSRVYPTGLIETPEAERILSPEDQAYLDKIYEDLDLEYISSSYDARSQVLVRGCQNSGWVSDGVVFYTIDIVSDDYDVTHSEDALSRVA